MQITMPRKDLLATLPWRSIALGCMAMSAITIVASVVVISSPLGVPWPPVDTPFGQASAWVALPRWSPVLAGLLGLLSGAISLYVVPVTSMARPSEAGAAAATAPPLALSSGLLAVVQELRAVLGDERSKVAAFQEACSASTREARVVSVRVARMTDAALDAETRLAASVAQAAEALRPTGSIVAAGGMQPAEAVQRYERLLPEIAEAVSRGIADQTKAVAAALAGAEERLVARAETSVQDVRMATAVASAEMAALAHAAAAARVDMAGLESAGREIAVASAMVVSRLGGAVANVDAAAAHLPGAAAGVIAVTEQAVQSFTGISAALHADSAARQTFETANAANIREMLNGLNLAVAELGLKGQEVADAGHGAIIGVTNYAEAASALLANNMQTSTRSPDESAGPTLSNDARLAGLTEALDKVVTSLMDGASNLDAAGRRMTNAGDRIAEQMAIGAARDEAVLSMLPVAANNLTAASETLRQEAAALAGAAGAAAAGLGSSGQAISTAAHLAIANVADTVEAASAQLAASIAAGVADARAAAEADQGPVRLAHLASVLEQAADILVAGASSLDAAGQRALAASDCIAVQMATSAARDASVLSAMPDVAAGLTTAAAGLRLETISLTTAAQQLSAAGAAATSAIEDAAVRGETAASSLNSAGETMHDASHQVGTQIERLAEVNRQAELHASRLPEFAADLANVATRLQVLSDAWPPSIAAMLPDAARRLEIAVRGLNGVDALSLRMQEAITGLSADPERSMELQNLASLLEDVGGAVRRVEATLSARESIWGTVAAAMAQVQAATTAVSSSAGSGRAGMHRGLAATAAATITPGDGVQAEALPIADHLPAALAATLNQPDTIPSQSEIRLFHSEALAEAARLLPVAVVPDLADGHTPPTERGIAGLGG